MITLNASQAKALAELASGTNLEITQGRGMVVYVAAPTVLHAIAPDGSVSTYERAE